MTVKMKNKMINTNKRLFLTLVIILMLQAATGQVNNAALPLQNCIKMGLENNNKLKQAELESLKSKLQYKEALSYGLPQIKVNASLDDYLSIPVTMIPGEIIGQPGTMFPAKLGAKYNSNAGVEAGQMIYNQTYFTSLQLFKKSCEISDLTIQKNREELAYNIAQIYFLIQITDLQLNLLDSNLVSFKKVLDFTTQQLANGLIRKIDLNRMTVAVGNLEAERANLLSMRDQQLNMLKYLIGMEQSKTLILTENLESFDSYLILTDTSFSHHADMMILKQRKELAGINMKLSRSEYLPTLTGYAAYSFISQCEDLDMLKKDENWYKTSLVGLKLSVPIFEGFRVKNKVGQNKIEINQLKLGLEDLKNELNTNYANALQKMNTNKMAALKQQDNMKLAENIFLLTNEQYQQGLKSLTDVLNAQSEYNTSRLLWLNALLQLKLSELEILKINGGIQSLYVK